MAALVLSTAGAAAGTAVFGPAGAIAGRLVGAIAGNAIDHALFANRGEVSRDGPRLADLEVMASTAGAPIPRIYGRARLAGQVIWATNLEEVCQHQFAARPAAGKGTGGGSPVDHDHDHLFLLCQFGGGPVRRTDRGGVARSGRTASRSICHGLTIRIYAGR